MVEVYNDVSLRLCPIDESDALDMIAEVKGARLLEGFRGQPAADIAALADTWEPNWKAASLSWTSTR